MLLSPVSGQEVERRGRRGRRAEQCGACAPLGVRGQLQTCFHLKPLQLVFGKCFEAKMIKAIKWEIY